MLLTQPKNTNYRTGNLLNLAAVFALITHILNPGVAFSAEASLNSASSSQNITKTTAITKITLAESTETTISEAPWAKLLNTAPEPDRVLPAVITAYTSTPDQTDDSPFYGARGTHVYDGMIAVNGLPFGTRVKIPGLYGDKIFTVDDRMNKRYFCHASRCRMDIWLDTTKKEAIKFGVKRVDVEVYYPVKELAVK